MRNLIVIGGPTGSGKTELAIRLARHFSTEILSADSRQFYREMDIGTAKPSPEQQQEVKHHFINSLSIHQPYSAGDFERDALNVLQEIFQTREYAILTGGSGLFLKALCEGLDEFPPVPEQVRSQVQALYDEKGLGALQQRLAEADPPYFREVDLNNPARLIRALAVCIASGQPYSSFRGRKARARPFRPVYLELSRKRSDLYRRIDQRVDQMVARGLIREARALYPLRHLPALRTVGYQELFDCFDGECTLETAIANIRQHSRNYAKRQLTWSRRDRYWKHFHPSEWPLLLRYLDFSAREYIFWKQKLLDEKLFDFPVREGARLVLCTDSGKHREIRLEDTPHTRILLPSECPEAEVACWLLHEAILRAEEKPVLAFPGPGWDVHFRHFGFAPLGHRQLPKKEMALVALFQDISPVYLEEISAYKRSPGLSDEPEL
ncbi:MAG: tRNA (adenosine(37)-N6)-dimethylallyltransferase MiaA [Saprospiraceae bacterium]